MTEYQIAWTTEFMMALVFFGGVIYLGVRLLERLFGK